MTQQREHNFIKFLYIKYKYLNLYEKDLIKKRDMPNENFNNIIFEWDGPNKKCNTSSTIYKKN